jgi:hypothetical protein
MEKIFNPQMYTEDEIKRLMELITVVCDRCNNKKTLAAAMAFRDKGITPDADGYVRLTEDEASIICMGYYIESGKLFIPTKNAIVHASDDLKDAVYPSSCFTRIMCNQSIN